MEKEISIRSMYKLVVKVIFDFNDQLNFKSKDENVIFQRGKPIIFQILKNSPDRKVKLQNLTTNFSRHPF